MSTERQISEEIRSTEQALGRVMRPESVGPWLRTPNPAFEGRAPVELIEGGEAERIRRMIHELESGAPT